MNGEPLAQAWRELSQRLAQVWLEGYKKGFVEGRNGYDFMETNTNPYEEEV